MEKDFRIEVKLKKHQWKFGLYDYTYEEAEKAKRNMEEVAAVLNQRIKVRIVNMKTL